MLHRKVQLDNGSVMSEHMIFEITHNYRGNFTRLEVESNDGNEDETYISSVVLELIPDLGLEDAYDILSQTWDEYIDPSQEMLDILIPTLTDEQALLVPSIWPSWEANVSYLSGDRVLYDNILYKCLQNHISQETWTPSTASSLWSRVLTSEPNNEGEVTPSEWVQPDSTNAYMTGDRVIFEGHIYESLIDNNIWSPSAYPAGWSLVQ